MGSQGADRDDDADREAVASRARGHRVFYSTHPDDLDRIASDEKEIDNLPPKAGLIEDSPRFQELKKKL
jgi:hypothetical protein